MSTNAVQQFEVAAAAAATTPAAAPGAGEKRERHGACQVVKRKMHKAHGGEPGYIYVKRDTNPYALVKLVRKLLVGGTVPRVTLVGMGAAVTTACDLALRTQGVLGGPQACRMTIVTGTIDIVDEIVPDNADEDEHLQRRRNNTIEITLASVRNAANGRAR